MFKILFLLIRVEVLCQSRQPRDHLLSLAFFAISALALPLAIGPDVALLGKIAAGFIWILALLAVMMSMGQILDQDHQQGVIAHIRLSAIPISLYLIAKAIAYWLFTSLPLILFAPILGLWLALPSTSYIPLLFTLLLGTPVLSFIGVMMAALTAGRTKQVFLQIFLMLPLTIPLLIFATSAIETTILGLSAGSYYLLMACLLPLSVIMTSLFGTMAIK